MRSSGSGTRELVFPPVEYYPIPALTDLQPTGNTTDIYYYHTNHLGSTAYVTDQSQNITQGFLYAPFGEITTEFNATFGSDIIPKYSFNAKELDEETGMYYYEARYYKPPVFTSRDPMFEKYFWMTPYAYCANNPVKYVDPDGRDYITGIDQKNKTITIRAKYYTSKENEAELEKALDVWNRQSKKYYYVVGKGKDKQKYAIIFDLQITSYETQEKAKRAYNNDESGMANFYDGRTYKGEDRGETNNGRFIHLNENNALIPNSNRTLSHEVGHSIGLSEWEHGLMESGGTEEWICKDFISQILSTAGFNMCVPMVSIGGNTMCESEKHKNVWSQKQFKEVPNEIQNGKVKRKWQ
jgi:RHS repeat-associated protein